MASKPEAATAVKPAVNQQRVLITKVIGFVLGLLVCAYVWTRPMPSVLKPGAMPALAIMIGMVIWWIFQVFDEYAIALIFPTYLIAAGIVKPAVAVGALTQSTWWTLITALAIGVVVVKSGLLKRIAYGMLLLFPPTYRGQSLAFIFSGLITAPFIPTALGKMAILNPIALEVSHGLGYKDNSSGSAGLGMSVWIGFSLTYFLFLTGSTTPLALHGLLPKGIKETVNFTSWIVAAWPLAVTILLLSTVALFILYRPEKNVSGTPRTVIRQRLTEMGKMSRNEWLALGTLIFLVIGWSTENYHHISSAWIGTMALSFMSFTKVMTKEDFKKIDWPFLFFLAAIISFGDVFKALGIDQYLGKLTIGYLTPLASSPFLFAVVLALATYVLRLFIASWIAYVTIMITLLTPFVTSIGWNPFAAGLILLAALNTWVPSYQSSVYLVGYYSTGGKAFTQPQSYKLGLAYLVIVLLALIPTIPYWKMIGLIP